MPVSSGARFGAALMLALAINGRAQIPASAEPIDSGTLVRLHLLSDSIVRGRLIGRLVPPAATIVLCRFPGPPCTATTDPGVARWPLASVQQLEVSKGSAVKTGAVIGFLIGLVVGTELGQFCIDGPCPSAGHAAVHVGLPVAGIFAFIGGAIGDGKVRWGTSR